MLKASKDPRTASPGPRRERATNTVLRVHEDLSGQRRACALVRNWLLTLLQDGAFAVIDTRKDFQPTTSARLVPLLSAAPTVLTLWAACVCLHIPPDSGLLQDEDGLAHRRILRDTKRPPK